MFAPHGRLLTQIMSNLFPKKCESGITSNCGGLVFDPLSFGSCAYEYFGLITRPVVAASYAASTKANVFKLSDTEVCGLAPRL